MNIYAAVSLIVWSNSKEPNRYGRNCGNWIRLNGTESKKGQIWETNMDKSKTARQSSRPFRCEVLNDAGFTLFSCVATCTTHGRTPLHIVTRAQKVNYCGAQPQLKPWLDSQTFVVAAATDGGQFEDRRWAERLWFTASPPRGGGVGGWLQGQWSGAAVRSSSRTPVRSQ